MLIDAGERSILVAMNAVQVRHAFTLRPFRPVEIELVSGTKVVIRHPEGILITSHTIAWVNPVKDDIVMTTPEAIAAIRRSRGNGRARASSR